MIKKKELVLFLVTLLLLPFVSADFSIVMLPDTQKYSAYYPEIFTQQTQWIADNVDDLNIVFVTHVGDVVDNWDSIQQWNNAKASMSVLDGKVAYGVAPGSSPHDMSPSRNTTFFNQYFPAGRISTNTYPAGKNDNSYHLFSADGTDYIIIQLIFCPTEDVIQWTNNILQQNSTRQAIITTHGFLNAIGGRNIHSASGGCIALINNTQYIWDELIYPNPNVFLVLSGHVHTEARRVDPNVAGKPVYQLLADYQDLPNGGDGWLRILKFSGDNIYVQTYSPFLDSYQTDTDSEFTVSLSQTNNNYIIVIYMISLLVGLILLVTYYHLPKRKIRKYFLKVLRLG